MMLNFDVIVIGGGIAGITAAIYVKQAGLSVAIIERETPGGKLNKIKKITNYPGFDFIDGPDLAYNLYNQISKLNIDLIQDTVINIEDNEETKQVIMLNKKITCKGVIIATGRPIKRLGIKNEDNLLGKGISYCAVCDGNLYKDKIVAVFGNDKLAIEDAVYLSNIASKVFLINNKDSFTEELESLLKLNNVVVIYNANIIEAVEQSGKLSKIILSDRELMVDALFIANGKQSSVFFDMLGLNQNDGFLIVNEKMQTNIKNIYACGDIIKKDLYQLSTAVGEGAIAGVTLSQQIKKSS